MDEIDEEMAYRGFNKNHYKIFNDGKNAFIYFGKYNGLTVKEINSISDGWIEFMLKTDIPKELKKVLKRVQKNAEFTMDIYTS